MTMRRINETFALLPFETLPEWRKDNPYIRRGYRSLTYSYWGCCWSLTFLHNQTVNTYTHLVGFLIFGVLGFAFRYSIYSRYTTATQEDAIAFLSFFVGVFTCFGFSTAYHLFSNHSEGVYESWLVLDFLGILCLVAGSWVPGVYYGFYCYRAASKFYLTMILSLSAVCTMICVAPYCRKPSWALFRTTMFVSLGLSGFLPMTYAASKFGVVQAHLQMGWGWFILEAVFYISGAIVYASKHPEKLKPGTFDIFGSSHQIFHVLVVLGAASHLVGIVQAFDYNHSPATRLCDHM